MKFGDTKAGMKANIRYFIKWSVLALVIGSVAGAAGTIFSMGVSWATGFRLSHPSMLFFLPVSGLLIVWMYHTFHEEGNRGTNMVIDAISSNERVTPATGPLIFFSTILTHLGGGSSGREGAALQLGGSIGNSFGEWFKLDERDKKIAIMCGMSAVFSALFGTPVAAAIFSLEVVSIGVLYYAALVPCVFSAFLGAALSSRFGLKAEAFSVGQIPEFGLYGAALSILFGILCACVGIVLCISLHKSGHLYRKYLPNPFLRILAGSGIFILLTLIFSDRTYNGSGMALIERCFEGEAVPMYAFLLKILFTAVALGAGFKGGEIVPTLCVGAVFGCTAGTILHAPAGLCTAMGMACLFVSVTNCPVSTMFLAFEMFGFEAMPYYALAVGVCFTLSGYYGLYSSQKFIYSKTRAEYINRKSH